MINRLRFSNEMQQCKENSVKCLEFSQSPFLVEPAVNMGFAVSVDATYLPGTQCIIGYYC